MGAASAALAAPPHIRFRCATGAVASAKVSASIRVRIRIGQGSHRKLGHDLEVIFAEADGSCAIATVHRHRTGQIIDAIPLGSRVPRPIRVPFTLRAIYVHARKAFDARKLARWEIVLDRIEGLFEGFLMGDFTGFCAKRRPNVEIYQRPPWIECGRQVWNRMQTDTR